MQLAKELLRFSATLQRVATYEELLRAALQELQKYAPYKNGWFFIAGDDGDAELLAFIGNMADYVRERYPRLRVEGDALLTEVMRSHQPVVVIDSRTDPRTNKELGEDLGNRTIINIPLLLHDERLGAFGVGTFGAEGVIPPTDEQLAVMVEMASHMALAASRIRSEERRRELEKRMWEAQRLESLGLLAGQIAHDLNNMLAAVIGNLDLASRKNPSVELQSAKRAASMAAELARLLLAYSGRGTQKISPLDLSRVVHDMEALLSATVASNVDLIYDLAPALPSVNGDEAQIRQVVHNLVLNASDAIGTKGSVRIATEASHDSVVLTVTDDGCGMSKETLKLVFEPFFSTKARGRGLGMSAVSGIVRAHSGEIRIDSQPGRGTRARVAFPVGKAPADPNLSAVG